MHSYDSSFPIFLCSWYLFRSLFVEQFSLITCFFSSETFHSKNDTAESYIAPIMLKGNSIAKKGSFHPGGHSALSTLGQNHSTWESFYPLTN